jgi:multiple sugar transport system substrate-binding protein
MLKSVLMAGVAAVFTLGLAGTTPGAKAQDLIFLSTQLRPIDEAQKVRDVILKGAPETSYVVDEPSPFTVRMKAEVEANKHTISLLGALHGELSVVE